jgi:hypothetical protein
LRYLAEDPFAFETLLRQLAAAFEAAARSRPVRPLEVDEALRRLLERLVGGLPAGARPLRGAAARQSVAVRRAIRKPG